MCDAPLLLSARFTARALPACLKFSPRDTHFPGEALKSLHCRIKDNQDLFVGNHFGKAIAFSLGK
jgi:hypothetical protein